MEISTQYNRWYHGVLLKQSYDATDTIYFSQWMDTNTGGVLHFDKGVDYHDLNDLKQIFKLMNIDYPIDGENKISTTKVDVTVIQRHIEFVIKTLGENSIELDFIRQEWDLLLTQCGIIK